MNQEKLAQTFKNRLIEFLFEDGYTVKELESGPILLKHSDRVISDKALFSLMEEHESVLFGDLPQKSRSNITKLMFELDRNGILKRLEQKINDEIAEKHLLRESV